MPARLSGLPAYVSASRFVILIVGSVSRRYRTKLAPIKPQHPVTRIRLIGFALSMLILNPFQAATNTDASERGSNLIQLDHFGQVVLLIASATVMTRLVALHPDHLCHHPRHRGQYGHSPRLLPRRRQ